MVLPVPVRVHLQLAHQLSLLIFDLAPHLPRRHIPSWKPMGFYRHKICQLYARYLTKVRVHFPFVKAIWFMNRPVGVGVVYQVSDCATALRHIGTLGKRL